MDFRGSNAPLPFVAPLYYIDRWFLGAPAPRFGILFMSPPVGLKRNLPCLGSWTLTFWEIKGVFH